MMRARFDWILIAVAMSIGGCADLSRTEPTIDMAATLDGRWQLDKEASDDIRARLLPLFDRTERHWRRNEERFDDSSSRAEVGSSPGADDGISHFQWLRREREKENETLIAMLSPATRLEITHSDRSIRIASDKGEGTRVVTPGDESTLFLPVGGFEVSSSWKKGGLLIVSDGTGDNKLHIVELFTPRGDVLEEYLEVKLPGIGKQSFRAVYKR